MSAQPLADVPAVELLEVHLVNAVAPFILCAQLKPLMMRFRLGKWCGWGGAPTGHSVMTAPAPSIASRSV